MDAAITETRMDRLAEDKRQLCEDKGQLCEDKKQLANREKQLRDKELLLYTTVSVATPFQPIDEIKYPFFATSIYSAVEKDGWISFDQIIPCIRLKKLHVRES